MRHRVQGALGRREFIASTAGGVGVSLLAGCLGGGDEKTTVTIGTSGSGTSADTGTQALQRAMTEHSDSVQISPQTTGGFGANPRLYEDGEIDAGVIDNDTVNKALNDEAGYADDPVEELPYQGFGLAAFEYHMYARDGTGIETTDDLAGANVWPQPPEFGTRVTQEELLENAGLWDEIEVVNLGVSDLAGALEEERIDAFVAYGTNGVDIPSWAKEVDARVEINLVDITDEFEQAIQDTPGSRFEQFEPYGWEQDLNVQAIDGDVVGWILDVNYYFGRDLPNDVVYEIARVSHEHNDTVREAEPTYPDHSDPANMATGILPDVEIHPGVAEYWRDVDVWDDSWAEGE